jgi:hypothetical protein
MTGIDPHLLDVIHEGAYWTKAPRIDQATLVLIAAGQRKPKPWAPSIYDDRPGIVGERTARNLRHGS